MFYYILNILDAAVPETSVDDDLDDYFFYEEELTGFDDMGPPPLLSREDSDYYHQAGPVPLPDDVPVDFLVGKMNLRVILPKGQCVRMSVERRYFIPPYTNEIILFFF